MINIPQIDAGKVPIAGPPSVIPQRPFVDPAGIIMQAAQLKQQKDLEQQRLQQQSFQSLMENVNSAASLAEKKRESQVQEENAAAILALKEQTTPVELGHIKAQTALANAQAQMMSQVGGSGAIMAAMASGQLPISMGLEAFSNRNGMRSAVLNKFLQDNPGVNAGDLEARYREKITAAQTGGGASVQIPTAMAQSFGKMVSTLPDLAKQAGITDYPAANETLLWLHHHVKSNPDVAKYETSVSESARQLAQVFSAQGVPTDYAAKAANDILSPSMGLSGLSAINQDTLPSLVSSRVNALSAIGVPITKQKAPIAPAGIGFDSLYQKYGLK